MQKVKPRADFMSSFRITNEPYQVRGFLQTERKGKTEKKCDFQHIHRVPVTITVTVTMRPLNRLYISDDDLHMMIVT